MKLSITLAAIPAALIALGFLFEGPAPAASEPAQPLEESAQEPVDSDLFFDPANTALVVTDPQNDFLSPEGVT